MNLDINWVNYRLGNRKSRLVVYGQIALFPVIRVSRELSLGRPTDHAVN